MLNVSHSNLESNINLYFDGKVNNDDVGALEVLLSIVFIVFMVPSVIGNACTCAVIIRDRTMRTPTNYYLLNLAIADLITALFVPMEITLLWIPYLFGNVTGYVVIIFWDLLCNSSVLTILALTIERYIVISKPFVRHTVVPNSRVFKIIAMNWTISATFCVLNIFFVYNTLDTVYYDYIYFNVMTTLPDSRMIVLMTVEVVIFFILPMVVIAMLYTLIILKLNNKSSLRHSPTIAKQNRSKAIKMLAAIAASFFFCWSPFCVLRVLAIIPCMRQKKYTKIWQFLCYLNCVNSYASTAVNPILYSLMSNKFRRAFKELLKRSDARQRRTSSDIQKNRNISEASNGIPITRLKLNI